MVKWLKHVSSKSVSFKMKTCSKAKVRVRQVAAIVKDRLSLKIMVLIGKRIVIVSTEMNIKVVKVKGDHNLRCHLCALICQYNETMNSID